MIPVDAYVYGCPMTKDRIPKVVKSLLLGKKPEIPTYPVCVECKKNQNICAFERGQLCVGPVTRAGCDSWCVNEGTICWGCRGLMVNPNENAEKEVLIKYGLTVDDAISKFKLYFGWQERQKMKNENLDLEVHHVTRVEGHGNIFVNVKKGKIEKCEWAIPEAPRFFEAMVVGRQWNELHHITSRICGICCIGHTLASLKATEAAMGITNKRPRPQTEKTGATRRKPAKPHFAFRLPSAPDLLGVGSVIPLASSNPQEVKTVLRLAPTC